MLAVRGFVAVFAFGIELAAEDAAFCIILMGAATTDCTELPEKRDTRETIMNISANPTRIAGAYAARAYCHELCLYSAPNTLK